MLAFESLTPEELLKEVAEYLRMEAVRQQLTVDIFDRKPKLTRNETITRAQHNSAANALRRVALDLDGAGIIPANSVFRDK